MVCLHYTRKHLSWHQRFSQYNPTTIVWRYFAIADRRIRAKDWSAADMAASNVLFWTPCGWDGSEEMIQRSREYCLKLPKHSRTELFSKASVTTVVITIQGVQAMYTLIEGFLSESMANLAFDTMFSPIAVIGLLRLFAAPWLTDDYFYTEQDEPSTTPNLGQRSDSSKTPLSVLEIRSPSSMGLFESDDSAAETRFHPINSWRGRIFRIVSLVPLLVFWTISFLFLEMYFEAETTTLFLINVIFMLFFSVTVITHAYYFIRERSGTTIIPCIISVWYQIYTGILLLLALLLIVVAAIETRKTKCGTYTTVSSTWAGNDEAVCNGRYVNSNSTTRPFGLAMRYTPYNGTQNITQLPQGEFRIEGFVGLCIGNGVSNQYVVTMNSSSHVE